MDRYCAPTFTVFIALYMLQSGPDLYPGRCGSVLCICANAFVQQRPLKKICHVSIISTYVLRSAVQRAHAAAYYGAGRGASDCQNAGNMPLVAFTYLPAYHCKEYRYAYFCMLRRSPTSTAHITPRVVKYRYRTGNAARRSGSLNKGEAFVMGTIQGEAAGGWWLGR